MEESFSAVKQRRVQSLLAHRSSAEWGYSLLVSGSSRTAKVTSVSIGAVYVLLSVVDIVASLRDPSLEEDPPATK